MGENVLFFPLWSFFYLSYYFYDFPGGSVGKSPPANAGDVGSIPVSERFLGEGNGSPFSILVWKSYGQ